MRRIRVLLADVRGLFDDVREALAHEPDMEVVGEIGNGFDLLVAAAETRADVVVVRLRNGELPGISTHLVHEYPDLRVVGVSADRARAVLYGLQPHAVAIDSPTPARLLDAIRTAVRTPEA